VASRRAAHGLSGKHQRDLLRVGRDPGKLRFGLCRRSYADDAVAALVAIAQLAFDIAPRVRVFVDGEKDRAGHESDPTVRGTLATMGSGPHLQRASSVCEPGGPNDQGDRGRAWP